MFGRKKEKKQYKYEFKLISPDSKPIVVEFSMSPEVWVSMDERAIVELLLSKFLEQTNDLKKSMLSK